jgi:hypothetical protein
MVENDEVSVDDLKSPDQDEVDVSYHVGLLVASYFFTHGTPEHITIEVNHHQNVQPIFEPDERAPWYTVVDPENSNNVVRALKVRNFWVLARLRS